MSVVSVNLKPEDRRSKQLSDGTRTYTMPYIVVTDSILDGPKIAREAPGLPAIASTYSYGNDIDMSAYCISKEAAPIGDSRKAWIVTLEYTNNLAGSGGSLVDPPNPNPVLRPATYQRGTLLLTKPFKRDRNGSLVRNAAGDPYVDLPEINDAHYQIQVTKNVLVYSDDEAMEYITAVNSDTYRGQAARKWACLGFSGNGPLFENEYVYYEKIVTIVFARDGWDFEMLEQGYRVIRAGQAKDTLANGTKIQDPQLIDASGLEVPPTGAPVYRTWQAYRELPFAALGLE